MEYKDVLKARYSCRAYLDQPVSDELVGELVAMAQQVPSWGDTQPWKVYVASGDKAGAIRADLATAFTAGEEPRPDIPMPPSFEGQLMDRYRTLGKSLFAVLGLGREDKEARARHYANNFNAFGAPSLVYFTIPKGQTSYVQFDVGAMVTAFCLAAADHGLGTCILAALARYPDLVRTHIDIPNDELILIGVALGYPDETAAVNQFRSARDPLENVLRIFS